MSTASAARGRPRDPEIEQRVLRAARVVFAERGWVGFGLSHVAREAGVGKSALYLRWESPTELLMQALEDHATTMRVGFGPDFRENLVQYGSHLMVAYAQPGGLAAMRMYIEAPAFPDLYDEFRRRVVEPSLRDLYAMVDRAVETGQVPADTDPREVTHLVHGAALSRSMIDRAQQGAPDEAEARAIASSVVDRLLGAGAEASRP